MNPEHLIITTDLNGIDIDFITTEIQATYWAKDRSKDQILKSIKNSFFFSMFYEKKQIGFARVITDYSTFAYLCDVLITQNYQNKGYGKILLNTVLTHQELSTVKWLLRTKDAHRFYKEFGFIKTERPERYMEKII